MKMLCTYDFKNDRDKIPWWDFYRTEILGGDGSAERFRFEQKVRISRIRKYLVTQQQREMSLVSGQKLASPDYDRDALKDLWTSDAQNRNFLHVMHYPPKTIKKDGGWAFLTRGQYNRFQKTSIKIGALSRGFAMLEGRESMREFGEIQMHWLEDAHCLIERKSTEDLSLDVKTIKRRFLTLPQAIKASNKDAVTQI